MNRSEITVLVVDDDTSSRKSIAEVVKRHGYKVLEAKGYEEAINATRLRPIHAYLIDCMLPKLSGVQLGQKFREMGFTETPIVLFTGVFKDRAFAADAIEKTKALEVLHKPLLNDELLAIVDNSLGSIISSPKMPIYQLLAKPFASHRERRKALEQVEDLSGYDLPLVLCILMDAEVTGHLNCVAQDGSIFGVTFNDGQIVEVDVEKSKELLARVIVEQGFCEEGDVAEALKSGRKDIVEHLISSSQISPHAGAIARNLQMLEAIKTMISDSSIQMNFSPAHPREQDSHLDMSMLTPVLHEIIDQKIDENWMSVFYETWMDHPVRLGPNYTNSHMAMGMPAISRLAGLVAELRDEKTLEDIIEAKNFKKAELLKAIHLLAIRRIVVFDETKKAKVSPQNMERLKKVYFEIKDKNHYEVFRYFGAGQSVALPEVDRIYKEFAKANHPDKTPKEVSEENRKLVHDLFARVTEAYNVLKDQKKRDEYEIQIQRSRAKNQIRAEAALDEALKALQKGVYSEALKKAKESVATYPSHEGSLYEAWANLKIFSGNKWNREIQAQIKTFMDSYPPEKRRTAVYQTVQGIFYINIKDLRSAAICLDRALKFDPEFLPARREISNLESREVAGKSDTSWADDLGTAIRKIFKS